MNDQILAVSIEARINKLEKEMKKAAAITGRNFDAMEKRSKRAAGDIERHFASIGDRIGGIGKNISAGFIGGLVAGGITGIAARFADVARSVAEVGDEAKRAGLDVEAFQELKYVAEQNRLGVDSLVDGIKELNLRADEFITTGGGSAAEAFQRLGYDAQTLREKLKDPSALFTEIIGKLGSIDRAAQIRIADEVFGGTGGERFVQLIEQGEAGLNRTRQAAHDLGYVLDAETIAKADELDRKFNEIANTLNTNVKRAIVGVTADLVNFVNSLPKSEAELLGDMQARAADTQATIEQLTVAAGTAFPALEADLRELVIAFLDNATGAEEAKDAILAMARANPDFAPIAGDLNGLISLFATLTGQAREAAAAISAANSDPIGTLPTFEEFGSAMEPPATVAPVSVGRGGGRSSVMRAERDAAKELIAELENELRVIGMSEVEKRVDAELRKAGANATDAQKASIRSLVLEIENQNAAMEQMQTAMDGAKGLAKDFLGGLLSDLRNGVDGATALANAFGRLADKLLDMALDQLINSLFSNMMGGLGGGLFGGLFGFKNGGVVEAATGGLIRGPGTGTSDSIAARLSDGEFVVRASQTAKHLDLLRAINDGKVAAFATGGLVGDGPAMRAANDNIRPANDNAPMVTINAPVTVNANGGTKDQNVDLAKQVARQLEGQLRGLVVDEMRTASRPGNIGNSRTR
jgi:hypothetical protein